MMKITTKRLLILRKLSIFFVCAVGAGIFGQNCSNGFAPNIYLDHFSSSSTGTSAEFLAAKAILNNRCVSCHSAGGSQPTSRLDLGSEQQFLLTGLIVAGNPDQSSLIQRLRNYTGTSGAKNMPPAGALPDSEYQTLRRWVMAAGATSADNNPYTCNPNDPIENKMLTAKLQLLTDLQYTNTIKDFLALTLPNNANAIYNSSVAPYLIGSGNGGRSFPDLSKEKLTSYFNISDKVAAEVSNSTNGQAFLSKIISLNPGACVSPSISILNAECTTQFVRNIGLVLYRRPLTEGVANNELDAYKEEFNITSDRASAISNVVMRMMMSQHFLYHVEDSGLLSPSNPKLLQLSSFAVANRLSYTFWNTMPDQNLLNLARNNNLQDNLKFVEAMNYVLSSNRVDSSLKEFAYSYLVLNKTPVFNPNTASLSNFSQGVQFDANMTKAMNEEAQELVSYVARNNGKFSDLFTTDVSFARYSPLMQIYGVTTPAPAVVTPQNAVRMPAGTRAGVLTRAALLSEGSGGQHVIHRAVRIKRDLLCMPQAPAPADVTPPVPLTDAQFQSYTFRQRTAHNTGSGSCFSCHQTINQFGYPLSKYNGLGFYQQTEPAFNLQGQLTGAQLPTDSTSDLSGVLSGVGQVSDAIQYSTVIGQRPEAQTCFTRSYASFVLGRAPDLTKEGCRLNKMYSLTKAGTLKDAISSLATDVEFRHRKLD